MVRISRRRFMQTAVVTAGVTLGAPSVHTQQGRSTLRFIAHADLKVLDPIWTPAYVTLYHSYMVYDTLYGQTGRQFGFKCTPQMVAGHVVENDGKTWRLTLRDELLFHNGERVRLLLAAAFVWVVLMSRVLLTRKPATRAGGQT